MLKGEKIRIENGRLIVSGCPLIPYIEGDGTGPDIWRASKRVFDACVEKAYGGQRQVQWKEVLAGEKAFRQTGNWLPEETISTFRECLVGIKGPLTTPVGGGIRSLNVALRQLLDLYVCLRPVRWFKGVPSPVKNPGATNMTIFRENTEDIYAGVEWMSGTKEANKVLRFLQEDMGVDTIRFPDTSSVGIKPISKEGTERLVRAAIEYAVKKDLPSVTFVHKGNIMKYTEGAFRDWGYALARKEYNAAEWEGGPWCKMKNPVTGREIIIKDVIADAFLQQILTRSDEFSVIATMNLNGDYISDTLAAIVGGIGIAPGANINFSSGHAIFEATHGTAPKYAGLDRVNPGSLILSGALMFEYIGWTEVTNLIYDVLEKTIAQKKVTYDFHRLTEGATLLKTSEFATEMINKL